MLMEQIQRITVDELYISPFSSRRVYSEDGAISWVPVERNLNPTGQRHLDFIARSMSQGHADLSWIAQQLHCSVADLCAMIRVLTGIGGRDFRHEYGFRVVDDLLRYTSMTVGEIAQHTGFHSASSLCQQYIKYRHTTPDARRKAIRQERDEGRYRL